MSEDLDFDLWLPRPSSPGAFAKKVLGRLPRYGLRFGGQYNDARRTRVVNSDWEDRSTWPEDWKSALEVSEQQGWGQVAYEFDLEDGERWDFDAYVGPRPRWKLPSEEVKELSKVEPPFPTVRKEELEEARWWLVHIETTHNAPVRLEMPRFLDSKIVPICRWLRPTFAFGDVWDYGTVYKPTTADLDRGLPTQVCWFNYYRKEVVDQTGIRSRLEGIPESAETQTEIFDDGDALLVVSRVPYGPDSGERKYWCQRLRFGSSSTESERAH